jgi:hypothetical protein
MLRFDFLGQIYLDGDRLLLGLGRVESHGLQDYARVSVRGAGEQEKQQDEYLLHIDPP